MTTKYPVPISSGMKLHFWCWYSIANNRDCAFVEVSKDGRKYDLLGKFTGYSGGWCYYEYSLSNYVGKSIFIRFRYTTNNPPLAGFYVDDIYPVANFGTVTTLSSSITNNYFQINGRPPGTYYYRVKAITVDMKIMAGVISAL